MCPIFGYGGYEQLVFNIRMEDMSIESVNKEILHPMQDKSGSTYGEKWLKNEAMTSSQVKKSVAILICFVILRLLVSRLWDYWFDMGYELSAPFLVFLFATFLLMSVGLVYLGFTRWVGIDIGSWWFKPGRIKGDIKWGIGTIILGGMLVFGAGIVMLLFSITPPMLAATQENEVPLSQTLSQIPIDLVLGWFFGFGIAAFQEGTIFRGFLQGEFTRRYGSWVGNLLQALIFSLAHLGMTPFGSIGGEIFSLVFRFGSGLLFGWLRMKRGSLLPAGIVHGFIG